MIVRRGTAAAVSDLPPAHCLARPAGPQLTIEKRGDPGAAPRDCRAPSPGEQTAAVLGRPSCIRVADPVAVPGCPTASDHRPCHGAALAPGSSNPTLDPHSPAPHRRPVHSIRARLFGAAPGRREPDRGLSQDPGRTRRTRLPTCAQHRVANPQGEPASTPPLAAAAPPDDSSSPPKPTASLPPTSFASTPCCCNSCTSCSWGNTPPTAFISSPSRRTPPAPGSPSKRAIS